MQIFYQNDNKYILIIYINHLKSQNPKKNIFLIFL